MPTYKQKAFIAEYLKDFNATQAAIRAGYSEKWAGPNSGKLLKNTKIAAEIKRHLAERALSADEVLARISDQAKGSAEDYLTIDEWGYVSLDLERMKAEGKLHLVKKYKVTKHATEIELYDAQSALVHLGKHHGLWTDKDTADWRREVIELLKADKIPHEVVRAEFGDELARELFDAAGIQAISN